MPKASKFYEWATYYVCDEIKILAKPLIVYTFKNSFQGSTYYT